MVPFESLSCCATTVTKIYMQTFGVVCRILLAASNQAKWHDRADFRKVFQTTIVFWTEGGEFGRVYRQSTSNSFSLDSLSGQNCLRVISHHRVRYHKKRIDMLSQWQSRRQKIFPRWQQHRWQYSSRRPAPGVEHFSNFNSSQNADCLINHPYQVVLKSYTVFLFGCSSRENRNYSLYPDSVAIGRLN